VPLPHTPGGAHVRVRHTAAALSTIDKHNRYDKKVEDGRLYSTQQRPAGAEPCEGGCIPARSLKETLVLGKLEAIARPGETWTEALSGEAEQLAERVLQSTVRECNAVKLLCA
jgi:hypothetical protein